VKVGRSRISSPSLSGKGPGLGPVPTRKVATLFLVVRPRDRHPETPRGKWFNARRIATRLDGTVLDTHDLLSAVTTTRARPCGRDASGRVGAALGLPLRQSLPPRAFSMTADRRNFVVTGDDSLPRIPNARRAPCKPFSRCAETWRNYSGAACRLAVVTRSRQTRGVRWIWNWAFLRNTNPGDQCVNCKPDASRSCEP